MNPEELVHAGIAIAQIPDRALGASRYLAGMFLLRQGVEEALEAYWLRTQPGVERCGGRVQLVALPEYLEDGAAAREVAYCWNRLSSSCHHDAYELPPTKNEFDELAALAGRSVVALAE